MSTIKINVGGQSFETLTTTIEALPYFKSRLNFENNKEKVLFVDRDPKAFRKILDYLRDPQVPPPKKYWRDLEYYGIEIIEEEEETKKEETKEIIKIPDVDYNLYTRYFEFGIVSDHRRHDFLDKDTFLKKRSPVTETSKPCENKWFDQENLMSIPGKVRDIGTNILLIFEPNEIYEKYLSTPRDYFDLIKKIDIYCCTSDEIKNISSLEDLETTKLFESCSGEDLYFRFKYAQTLENNEESKFPNIIPIFVANMKHSKRYEEHVLPCMFEELFVIHIQFNEGLMLKIDHIRTHSVGYYFAPKGELYYKVDGMTIYRWNKFSSDQIEYRLFQQYQRENKRRGFYTQNPKLSEDGCWTYLFGNFAVPSGHTDDFLIDCVCIKVEIKSREEKHKLGPKNIRFLSISYHGHESTIMWGQMTSLEYIQDDRLVLWYVFKFNDSHIRLGNLHLNVFSINFSNSIPSDAKIKVESNYYEIINYKYGVERLGRNYGRYNPTPHDARSKIIMNEK